MRSGRFTRNTSKRSGAFACVAVALGLGAPALAGPRFDPQLPSLATWELAEQARVRRLTAPELTTISRNWYSTYIYLEAALQAAMLHRDGSAYRRLPTRPTDGCLNAAMFDLIPAVEDGHLTLQELDALWNGHGGLAYLAHQIGTAGGTTRSFEKSTPRPDSSQMGFAGPSSVTTTTWSPGSRPALQARSNRSLARRR
jgi:hypothetical protein